MCRGKGGKYIVYRCLGCYKALYRCWGGLTKCCTGIWHVIRSYTGDGDVQRLGRYLSPVLRLDSLISPVQWLWRLLCPVQMLWM